MLPPKPLVIVLIGPTASGKTELGIHIAKHLNINIHNVDSRQLYRFMNIGTAKPTKEQQQQIKTAALMSSLLFSLSLSLSLSKERENNKANRALLH